MFRNRPRRSDTKAPRTAPLRRRDGESVGKWHARQLDRSTQQAHNELPSQANMPNHFVWNLVLLLVVGVAVLAWILNYTDLFPAIGGVLALGGALSWLAFVSRLLKEERLKQLQDWADGAIFNNPRTQRCVTVVGLLALVLACFVGTLELRSESGASIPRNVSIYRGDGAGATRGTLDGTMRLPRITAWWAPARMHVKLSGYPEVEATVVPWWRTTLVAPDQFLRPVVVLKPDKDLLEMLVNNPMTLSVRLASNPSSDYRLDGYRGETVWVGCDVDVDVPAQVLESWKTELATRGQTQHFHLWSQPLALPNGPRALDSGDQLTVRVLAGPASVYARADPKVRPVRTHRDYPQEEEIHGVPSGSSSSSPP
jgi:hypothetical protein